MTGNQEVNISVLVRNKGAYPVVNDTMTKVFTLYTHIYGSHDPSMMLTAHSKGADSCTRSC